MPDFKGVQKTVTTAGTPEALVASQTLVSWVFIQVMPSNNGAVYVEDSTGVQTKLGAPVSGQPLESYSIPSPVMNPALDLNEIYVDVDTDGEGVNCHYMEKI